jgi:hypothetical protein
MGNMMIMYMLLMQSDNAPETVACLSTLAGVGPWDTCEKRRDVAKYCVSVLLELFNTFVI